MKILVLGLAALLLGAGTAQADFEKEWIFKCNYTGVADKVSTGCRVLANVCKFTLENDTSTQGLSAPPQSPCIDFMIVHCGGQEIFSGPAEHVVKEVDVPWDGDLSFQVIKGIATDKNSHPPMFRYSTQAPGNANPFYISSWLKLGHDELKGFCEVYHPENGS